MSFKAIVQVSRRRPLVTLLAILAIGIPMAAFANDLFTDVPAAASFHEAANAIARAGVTTGCATGLYCPNANVTRAQMALFMHRGFGRIGKLDIFTTIDAVSPTAYIMTSLTPGLPANAIPGASGFVTANGHVLIQVVDSAACPCLVGALWRDETQSSQALSNAYAVFTVPAGSNGQYFTINPTGAAPLYNVVGSEGLPHIYMLEVNQNFGFGLGTFNLYGSGNVTYSPFGNTGTNTLSPQANGPRSEVFPRIRTSGN